MTKKKLPQTIEECNAELDDDSEIKIRPEGLPLQRRRQPAHPHQVRRAGLYSPE